MNHPLTTQIIEDLKRITLREAIINDCGHLKVYTGIKTYYPLDEWIDEQIEKYGRLNNTDTQPHQFLTSGYLKHDSTERRLFISKNEKELRDILEQLRWDKELEVGMIPAPVKVEVSREIVIKKIES